MNDDLSFELRASWREFDLPDSEQASLAVEQHRLNDAVASRSLIDQATSIVMSAHGIDRETAEQLLTRLADAPDVTLTALARAVVAVATGAITRTDVRAAQLALRLLPAVAGPEDDAPTTESRRRRLIDLRDAASAPPVAGMN